MQTKRSSRRRRRGTTAAETAIVLPVFVLFLFGIFEYSRAVWIHNMLKGACNTAAREGIVEGVSTNDVIVSVRQKLASSLDSNDVIVTVKNGGVYDTNNDFPESLDDADDLPNLELANAGSRQLFVVTASVSYNDISFIRFKSFFGLNLGAMAIERRE